MTNETMTSDAPTHHRTDDELERARRRFDRVFYGCPGAWVGGHPDQNYGGHITIDPTRTVEALAYLRRRRVTVTSTRLSPGCPGGLQLSTAM